MSTVTWNMALPVASTPFSTLIINDSNADVWRSFDVTAMVNAWISAPTTNYGMMLARVDDPNPFAYFVASFSGSSPNRPFLDVTPVPIPSALLLFGPGLIGLAAVRRRFKK